jgi:hypothetical protein
MTDDKHADHGLVVRPTSFAPLTIRRRLGVQDWAVPERFGPDGWSFVDRKRKGSIIVSCDTFLGVEWVHASIAWADHTPTYDDLKLLHAVVFPGWAYQVFPPLSHHVNIHEYALHLWGRLDGRPALPDFAGGFGSI